MNKYFQNKNKVTVQKLLKTYQNYSWGYFPHFGYNKNQVERLINQCQQSDEYQNWKSQVKDLEKQIKQLNNQIQQITDNRNEIVLKNSERQYEQVLNKLKADLVNLRSELSSKNNKPPKSKYELLKPIYISMQRGEQKARQEMAQRMREENARCHCSGHHCEC